MEATQPLTSAQIALAIRQLRKQRARDAMASDHRYRALVRESLELEIARLERQREQALTWEDQQRGALLRKYLTGRHARIIRSVLRRVVGARDAHLFFGPLEAPAPARVAPRPDEVHVGRRGA